MKTIYKKELTLTEYAVPTRKLMKSAQIKGHEPTIHATQKLCGFSRTITKVKRLICIQNPKQHEVNGIKN